MQTFSKIIIVISPETQNNTCMYSKCNIHVPQYITFLTMYFLLQYASKHFPQKIPTSKFSKYLYFRIILHHPAKLPQISSVLPPPQKQQQQILKKFQPHQKRPNQFQDLPTTEFQDHLHRFVSSDQQYIQLPPCPPLIHSMTMSLRGRRGLNRR